MGNKYARLANESKQRRSKKTALEKSEGARKREKRRAKNLQRFDFLKTQHDMKPLKNKVSSETYEAINVKPRNLFSSLSNPFLRSSYMNLIDNLLSEKALQPAPYHILMNNLFLNRQKVIQNDYNLFRPNGGMTFRTLFIVTGLQKEANVLAHALMLQQVHPTVDGIKDKSKPKAVKGVHYYSPLPNFSPKTLNPNKNMVFTEYHDTKPTYYTPFNPSLSVQRELNQQVEPINHRNIFGFELSQSAVKGVLNRLAFGYAGVVSTQLPKDQLVTLAKGLPFNTAKNKMQTRKYAYYNQDFNPYSQNNKNPNNNIPNIIIVNVNKDYTVSATSIVPTWFFACDDFLAMTKEQIEERKAKLGVKKLLPCLAETQLLDLYIRQDYYNPKILSDIIKTPRQQAYFDTYTKNTNKEIIDKPPIALYQGEPKNVESPSVNKKLKLNKQKLIFSTKPNAEELLAKNLRLIYTTDSGYIPYEPPVEKAIKGVATATLSKPTLAPVKEIAVTIQESNQPTKPVTPITSISTESITKPVTPTTKSSSYNNAQGYDLKETTFNKFADYGIALEPFIARD